MSIPSTTPLLDAKSNRRARVACRPAVVRPGQLVDCSIGLRVIANKSGYRIVPVLDSVTLIDTDGAVVSTNTSSSYIRHSRETSFLQTRSRLSRPASLETRPRSAVWRRRTIGLKTKIRQRAIWRYRASVTMHPHKRLEHVTQYEQARSCP